uniref:C2H2-type domain-containing protein n=1 Tax=Panagrolaimus sp. PS1159 TaxID=55785 RepID=A0AC35G9P0_9BILA
MSIETESRLDPNTGYTCISCRLVFASSALQRDHYQTEWHRYNVKRQVTGLPPISIEQFESKVQQFQETVTDGKQKKEQEQDYCVECGKRFKSQNAYDNHLNSKKHRENVQKFELNGDKPKKLIPDTPGLTLDETKKLNDKEGYDSDDDDGTGSWKTVDSADEDDLVYDETKALPSTSCLFCNNRSDTVEGNLEHMTIHGFFIPDAEYCIDVNGLLTYLGMKVGCGGVCVLCNKRSKNFRTLDAVQKHMRDKQHCRFSVDDDDVVEYLDFYDYGSLLTDEGDEDDNVAINEGYTLILPSGARLGHRALDRYYKQHLRLQEGESKSSAQNRKAINIALGKYKALGWTGATGAVAVMKARDISYMKRIASKHWMQQGMKANKLFKTKGRADQM